MCLVREIAQDVGGDWRFESEAIEALQVACKDNVTELNEDNSLLEIHANRVTVTLDGMKLAVTLRGNDPS